MLHTCDLYHLICKFIINSHETSHPIMSAFYHFNFKSLLCAEKLIKNFKIFTFICILKKYFCVCAKNIIVDEHQQNSNSPPGSNAGGLMKHGNGSGSKFLSVPGKSSFGNFLKEKKWKNLHI